jgi:hypothetical protein
VATLPIPTQLVLHRPLVRLKEASKTHELGDVSVQALGSVSLEIPRQDRRVG